MPTNELILVVEDAASEAVLRRILADLAPAWTVALVDNCGGATPMRSKLQRYRNTSHVLPHILLTDLDNAECASALMAAWGVVSEPPRLLFRVAVREIEAWLMGDRAGTAAWLQVPATKVPMQAEAQPDPKQTLLALGRASKSRRLRAEFCPAPGSSASQGPLYNDHIRRFVQQDWNLAAARAVVPSLNRACCRISELAGTAA